MTGKLVRGKDRGRNQYNIFITQTPLRLPRASIVREIGFIYSIIKGSTMSLQIELSRMPYLSCITYIIYTYVYIIYLYLSGKGNNSWRIYLRHFLTLLKLEWLRGGKWPDTRARGPGYTCSTETRVRLKLQTRKKLGVAYTPLERTPSLAVVPPIKKKSK